jgi:glycosyltransferase involved in cell wall biosynthesis
MTPNDPRGPDQPGTATPGVASKLGSQVADAVVAGAELERRVLVVAPQPFYEDRGTPIAVRQLLEALTYLGYQVDVLTFPVGRDLPIPGVRFHRVANILGIRAVPIGFSLRKVWLDLFLFYSLLRILRHTEYFCIHAVEEAAFLAVLAARRQRTPVIYDMQSSIPEQLAGHWLLGRRPLHAFLRAAERWLIGRVDSVVSSAGLGGHVLAIAPGAKVREWRYPSQTFATTPGAAAQLRAELGIEPGAKIILYTGNFEDYQGLTPLVEAIPSVLARVPEAVFVLVGADGPNRLSIARALASHAPTESHRILDRQPRERMPSFLRMADVVVSPRTHGSNLPLKTLEYLAAGCAIVATAIPAHRIVLNEERAVLAEPRPEALASAISGLLTNPQRLEHLRAAALTYAQKNLNWIGFVDSISEIYEQLRLHE